MNTYVCEIGADGVCGCLCVSMFVNQQTICCAYAVMCSPVEGTVQFAIYPREVPSFNSAPPLAASGAAGLQMRLICTKYRVKLRCPVQCGDICITFKNMQT